MYVLLCPFGRGVFTFHAEITYGMQSIYREIFENETNIEVCVEQKPPYSNANCPVDFPFSFTISVHDNTASEDFTSII